MPQRLRLYQPIHSTAKILHRIHVIHLRIYTTTVYVLTRLFSIRFLFVAYSAVEIVNGIGFLTMARAKLNQTKTPEKSAYLIQFTATW